MTRPISASILGRGFDLSTPAEGGYTRIRCSQCEALVVNGIPIHESGCPNETVECRGCNARIPKGHRYCEDCA
jgi:hypothetical protein